jgi:hypothetical protein
MSNFYESYGDRAQFARSVYLRRDFDELCDFTQELYLGMPSRHEWFEEK